MNLRCYTHYGWIIGVLALLTSCGDVSAPIGDGVSISHCNSDTDLPLFRKPMRMSMESHGNRLYVLDEYSGVSHWIRKSYGCDWELDRAWQNGGSLQFGGFAEELDVGVDGRLFVKSGSQLIVTGKDTCSTQVGSFAVAPGGTDWVLSSSFGPELWEFTATGCKETAMIPAFGASLSADFDEQGIVNVEASVKLPERLVAYSASGLQEWTQPFSIVESVEPFLCSSDRVRISSSEILVLDRSCGKLVAFERSGRWIASLMLDSLGLKHRRVLDVAIAGPGLAELLVDDAALTVQISWRALIASDYGRTSGWILY